MPLTEFQDLPAPVRQRVLAQVAEVLPTMPGLSPALRKVAGFTAGRRAKLGASALSSALADDDVRAAAAIQLIGRVPNHAASPDTADQAAWLWLTRPEGWQQQLALQFGNGLPEDSEPGKLIELRAENERLRAQLREQLREQRLELRAKLDEAKAENADLRRKLGETRSALRQAAATHSEDSAAALQAQDEAQTALGRTETELRRAKARIEELERAHGSTRQEERSQREDETIRARLLLDTLVDAAAGLRRELALPRVETSPAERIAAVLDPGDTATGGAVISNVARLEQHLALPRVHVILDGYNVTKSVWEATSLETQRTRLLSLLPALAARTNAEVTVVFDAAAVSARPSLLAPRGVRVLFSPVGVIADDVIRDLVAAEPAGRPVLVVTADAEIVRDVRADGAVAVAPAALISLLARGLRD